MKTHTKRKLTKYEEVVCKSILTYDIYFTYYGENCDLKTVVNNIFNQEDFDGYEVFAKFITSAVYEKQVSRETNFLPTEVEKETDMEKKFFTVNNPTEASGESETDNSTEVTEVVEI